MQLYFSENKMAETKYLENELFQFPTQLEEPIACPGLKFCFFGMCANPCVSGLMFQQARKGSMAKEHAGIMGCCYFASCYPCVCTDSCCLYICLNSAQQSDNAMISLIATAAETGVRIGVRATLLKAAGIDSAAETWGMSAVRVCCAPCFCTPCNNAAYVMDKHNPRISKLNLVF
jgi:hypothetical protein